jgi:hypothetical protein
MVDVGPFPRVLKARALSSVLTVISCSGLEFVEFHL